MLIVCSVATAILAVLLYGRYGAEFAGLLTGRKIERDTGLGAWGDSFGAFNATISTLAFIGIALTLLLQKRGLLEQAHDQHRQRFDASFFELIRLQREARRDLVFFNTAEFEAAREARSYTTFSSATTGRMPADGKLDAIAAADLEIHFQLLRSCGLDAAAKDDVVNVYMHYVHSASEATIAPYFRLIYSILERLRRDDILTDVEKVRYGNLVRSQLSSADVLLLGVNSLAPISADMRSLVTEYRMLKYLPPSSMRDLLLRLHDPEAFLGREDPVPPPPYSRFKDPRYRRMVAALQAERGHQRLARDQLALRIGKSTAFVEDFEEGRIELTIVELVDVARGLKLHPALFLRH